MPLISVIVPVYKVEPYIRRCIDSILSQSFTDFELILVDDGSPDNCPAICDEYVLKDNRVHVIHQKNGGLSAARNTGVDWVFANSNSQWIGFVDSDDWIHSQYLEMLSAAVIENNAEASACLYSFENECIQKPKIEKANCKSYVFEDFFCLRQNGLNTIIACGKLYKKELFINKKYPVGKINEDLFITPRVLYECNQIVVLDVVLYYYFQSDNSIMRKSWNIHRLDEIEGSENLIEFLKEKKLHKAEKVAIRRLFWVLDRQKKEINMLPQKNLQASRYLNKKYKRALFQYRKMCLSPELRYIYEKEFPKLAWCYWTCVGVVGKIKKTVTRNA